MVMVVGGDGGVGDNAGLSVSVGVVVVAYVVAGVVVANVVIADIVVVAVHVVVMVVVTLGLLNRCCLSSNHDRPQLLPAASFLPHFVVAPVSDNPTLVCGSIPFTCKLQRPCTT